MTTLNKRLLAAALTLLTLTALYALTPAGDYILAWITSWLGCEIARGNDFPTWECATWYIGG